MLSSFRGVLIIYQLFLLHFLLYKHYFGYLFIESLLCNGIFSYTNHYFSSIRNCVDQLWFNTNGKILKSRPLVFQTYVSKEEEKPYWNRKSRKSINTFGVMGFSKKFYALEADSKGSRHDNTVFMESVLYQLFDNGWLPFDGSKIVGDSAYRVSFFSSSFFLIGI